MESNIIFFVLPSARRRRRMALRIGSSTAPLNFSFNFKWRPRPNSVVSFPIHESNRVRAAVILCRAANSHSGPVQKKRNSSAANTKKKKKNKNKTNSAPESDDSNPLSFTKFDIPHDFDDDGLEFGASDSDFDLDLDYRPSSSSPMPLPEPPAGFLVGDDGKVLLTSTNRLATIVDPSNKLPLECVIRRVFRSSDGDECLLLCPVDTPVQILKSTNVDGWSAVSDEEVESIVPAAAYALAKIHMHLVHSGYCYTARGGFCYSEEDIFDFHTDDGKEVDGLPTEGVEITYFNLEGAQYMIYTPSDPLLFVAVKDEKGMLQIADDDLLEDPAIIDAIDEETEFNALVEEEAALHDSMMDES
ncbi:hypothetical protein HN51_012802 [Arachis hypogaea]|uniref:DUF3727 domain-containing protein n=1 Tax=Arachis hypogaea TaxID=3818 RepID=A0A445DSR8_ARAHY|nr:uncharacterized protein LOC112791079 [Arachis hypogaea]RYR66234.1 hypothetical protein Ahy_A03g012216 [Arachis hypogaea]